MTDPDRHLLTLFSAALERHSPEERAAYLDEACAGSPEARARVEALLRAHAQSGGGFLESPTSPHVSPGSPAAAPPEQAGSVIGPYKLLQEIGEGGMGTVFMAEQTEPIRRRVALKVVKAGMDSRQVLARFEAERQALALMDHPNIAKALDAGATPSGRPYFVMELVKGTPITRFCDEHRLGLRERVALFVSVCQAVQHAHQKGVIHRDIKPSNVLVAPYDGRPVPKVIDFGIAKATGQPLTEKTLFTGFGAVVGTPEYMSPEQAELNNQDIDTRSDVYSLGAMLYELLTGTTPLTAARARKAALLEVLRLVREEEPPRPSTRLSSTEELPRIATDRGTDPKKLSRLVRGEMDWIVMKALDKDRSRRYETANGLAADLQRYLDGEPVAACPPSATYRLRKFASRYRAALAVAAVFALTLVAGAAVSVWQAVRATDAEGKANERAEGERKEAERAVAAEVIAKRQADELRRQQRQARIDLSAFLLDRGLERCERGEVGVGLLWMGRALATGPDDDALDRVIRVNLAGWAGRTARLRTGLRHAGAVHRVAFSPDGKTVLTASEIAPPLGNRGAPRVGEVRRWDAATGRPVGKPLPHRDFPVSAITFSPDGRVALVGSNAKTAHLRDVETLRDVGPPLAHHMPVEDAQFSRDGRVLLTRTAMAAYLWDATTGRPIAQPIGSARGMSIAALSPDGRTVVTAGGQNQAPAQLRDVATRDLIGEAVSHPGACQFATFSPDGRHLLLAGESVRRPTTPGTVEIRITGPDSRPYWWALWDARTGAPVGEVHHLDELPHAATFSPDGTHVLIALRTRAELGRAGSSEQYGFVTPRRLDGAGYVRLAAFSPDGRTLLTAGWDGPVRIWSTVTDRLLGLLEHPGRSNALAFGPDGRTALSGSEDAVAWVADVPVHREAVVGDSLRSFDSWRKRVLAWAPDGEATLEATDMRYGRDLGEDLAIWEGGAGRPRPGAELAVNGRATAGAFAHGGRRALVSIVNYLPPTPIQGGPPGARHWAIAKTSTLWLWDGGKWSPVGPGKGPTAYVVAVAFAPNGREVLLSERGGPVRRWALDTWRPLGPPIQVPRVPAPGDPQDIELVVVSPDGELALTGAGAEVWLWRLATARPVGRPLRHQAKALLAAFSPDGRFVATGSADRTVRLWDVARGLALGPPLHHDGPVTGVAVSPDGRTVLTSSVKDGARLWDVRTGKPLGPSPLRGRALGFRPDGRAYALVAGSPAPVPSPAAALPGAADRAETWAEVASGRGLDEANVVGWLTPARWQQARARLDQQGAEPLAAEPALAWHRREGAAALKNQDWHAAVWHFDRLIAAEPADWRHHLDLARAMVGGSIWDSNKGLGRPEQALVSSRRAEQLGAKGADLWVIQGKAHARLGRWKEAVVAYRKAWVDGRDPEHWRPYAEAMLKAGDVEGYRRACAEGVDRLRPGAEPSEVVSAVAVCLRAQPPAVPPARLVQLAEKALAEARKGGQEKDRSRLGTTAQYEDTLAMCLYRAGRYRDVVKLLGPLDQGEPGRRTKGFPLLLALAHHHLGEVAAADAALERSATPRFDWHNYGSVLRDEAEAAFGRQYLSPHKSEVVVTAFLPGGSAALSISADGDLLVIGQKEGQEGRNIRTGAVRSAALSSDGRRLLTCGTDNTVRLWDVATGRQHHIHLVKAAFHRAAFTPDAKQAVLVAFNGHGVLIDLETFKVVRRHKFPEGLWSVDVSPRGGFALVAGGTPFPNNRAALHCWDLKTGEASSPFEQLKGGLWQGVLSPDGTQALSAGLDGHVRLWDVKTGKVTRSMAGHSGEVNRVAFAPDGRRALSGGGDGTVRLWDLATGKELAAIKLPGRQVFSFSADGKQALAGGGKGQVVMWRLPAPSANGR